MKHPNQATLALHAGGDLGLIARWITERHLANCDRCRDDVGAFAGVRELLPELNEIPDVPWNRLAAEMRANIRLGLAAGECVRTDDTMALRGTPLFTGIRAAVAFASIVVLMVTGLALLHPTPVAAKEDGVGTMADGIQVREGGQALRLMHAGVLPQDVTYSAGAQGSMRARYVDPQTGYVTINNVYVQ
jgi:hypothetical protein